MPRYLPACVVGETASSVHVYRGIFAPRSCPQNCRTRRGNAEVRRPGGRGARTALHCTAPHCPRTTLAVYLCISAASPSPSPALRHPVSRLSPSARCFDPPSPLPPSASTPPPPCSPPPAHPPPTHPPCSCSCSCSCCLAFGVCLAEACRRRAEGTRLVRTAQGQGLGVSPALAISSPESGEAARNN